jgi:hypothetical protein
VPGPGDKALTSAASTAELMPGDSPQIDIDTIAYFDVLSPNTTIRIRDQHSGTGIPVILSGREIRRRENH